MPWVTVTDPAEMAAAKASLTGGRNTGAPKLKPDYAIGADGIAAPIPGTPEAIKAQMATAAKATNYRAVANTANKANELIDRIGWKTSGPIGKVLSGIPGTDAYNLSRDLDTVRGNAGFDRLQAMRESSPTGGALGQVSDSEQRILQSTIGSLDVGQSADQLAHNLAQVRAEYRRRASALGGHNLNPQGQEVDPGTNLPIAAPRSVARPAATAPRKIMGDADYARLPSGAEFIAPDGSHRRKP